MKIVFTVSVIAGIIAGVLLLDYLEKKAMHSDRVVVDARLPVLDYLLSNLEFTPGTN